MSIATPIPPHAEADTRPANGVWRQQSLGSVGELDRVLGTVVREMADRGFSGADIFGMRLALVEAIVNAIRHGHRDDATKQVQVRYRVKGDCALAEVADQGTGFNPHAIADPLAPENLERCGGRGLLLMRAYLTWLRFNRRGNRVVLCKYRSGQGPAAGAGEE